MYFFTISFTLWIFICSVVGDENKNGTKNADDYCEKAFCTLLFIPFFLSISIKSLRLVFATLSKGKYKKLVSRKNRQFSSGNHLNMIFYWISLCYPAHQYISCESTAHFCIPYEIRYRSENIRYSW